MSAVKFIIPIMIAVVGSAYLSQQAWQGATIALAAEKDKGSAPAEVTVVRARKQWFRDDVHVTGYLVARKQTVVSPLPNYKVSEVKVREGDQVRSGDALARMTLQRVSGPAQGHAVPAQNSATEKSLEAPEAGTVIHAPTPQEPVFVIAVDNEVELEAEIAGIYVPKIAPGQTARIVTEKGHDMNGKVRIAPESVDQKQVGKARVAFTDKDPALRIGMFVRGTITVERREGISIPSSAVSHTTEGSVVQVVRDDTIENKRVETGLNTDTNTEIRSGLTSDDLVVVNSGSSLRPGMKVKSVETESRAELN